ncbi:MAG: hypothetical protein JWN97_1455 [Nocardioides sp.]|nr:hypothetical protein [Nocardioides sp.]
MFKDSARVSPVMRSLVAGGLILGAVVVLTLVPSMVGGYYLFLLTLAMTSAIFAMSLDLQWGYAGLINFGAAAPFALGAYGYALVTQTPAFASAYVAVPVAMLVAAIYGMVVAFPAFKARTLPLYYALLTLAGTLLLQKVTMISTFTNGFNGINGVAPLDISVPGLFELRIITPRDLYLAVLLTLIATFVFCRWLAGTPAGRVVRALREDERRCEALGYPVVRYKLFVACGTAALAGLAGALFAAVNANVTPALFGVQMSLVAFIWVALGGPGTLWGPAVAAIVLVMAEGYFSRASGELYLVVISGLFIVGVLFLPRGLAGLIPTGQRALRRGRESDVSGSTVGENNDVRV